MHLYTILWRLIMFSLTAFVCVWLNKLVPAAAAIGIWAVGVGILCCLVALGMHRQPVGKVTVFNYLAGIVLPWGYKIGRGKLLPIVIESWIRWVLLGAAVVALTAHGFDSLAPSGYHRGPVVSTLLLLCWVIDAAVLFRIVTMLAIRANDNPLPPKTFPPILALFGMIVVSAGLVIFGHSAAADRIALLICGGPILLIGGGYGLFLLVMMTAGRKARWN